MENVRTNELSVFAVVVTFNRPAVLRACMDSLLTQVPFGLEGIHVVVNSNDIGTKVLLQSYTTKILLTYEFLDNPGPAGGFNAGIRKFLQGSQSHVWLMDDDVVVRANCLRELLGCTGYSDYICPTVTSESGRELGSYGWWGILLSRTIVERVGLPLTDLFYWSEDTEYLQHRIKRLNNIAPYRCKTAEVNHQHRREEKRPSWYYYYITRNTLFYRIYIVKFSWPRLARTLILILNFFFRILFKEDRKIRKVGLMSYGIFHGVIGKIGKLIDPALNK